MIFQIGDPSGIMAIDVAHGLHGERHGPVLQICSNVDPILQVEPDTVRQFDQSYTAETAGLVVGYVTTPGTPPGLKGVRVRVEGKTPPMAIWQQVSSTGASTNAFCCPVPHGYSWRVERIVGTETGELRWIKLWRPPGASVGVSPGSHPHP